MSSVDPVFEFIKTFGSIAGWISAFFLIIDRFLKGRPILTIQTEPPSPGGLERDLALKVINSANAAIWIKSIEVHPNVYWPALSDSTEAAVSAALDGPVTEVLEPHVERAFPLVRRGSDYRATSELPFTVTLRWRKLSRPKWPQYPVRLRSSVPITISLSRAGTVQMPESER